MPRDDELRGHPTRNGRRLQGGTVTMAQKGLGINQWRRLKKNFRGANKFNM